MLYTRWTKKAMEIAYAAHKDQVDKGGMPYIFHPCHVAEQMDTEEEICAALLHDVAEDTDVTLEQLEQMGFPKTILRSLELLTYDGSIPYLDYIRRLKSDPVAVKVKKADLRHNSDLTRLRASTEKDRRRLEKYRRALELLET